MNHRRLFTLSILLTATACSSGTVSDTLGLNRTAPDEFRVVSRPPLSVPPQFSLRPPASADEAPSLPPADQQAKTMLLGTTNAQTGQTPMAVGTPAGASSAGASAGARPSTSNPAESAFLKDAGAGAADPTIRTAIEQDQALANAPVEEEEEHHWWNFFSSSPKPEPVVDASQETTRIKQNEAQGQPVTAGATPDVPQKDTGVLGSIFGY